MGHDVTPNTQTDRSGSLFICEWISDRKADCTGEPQGSVLFTSHITDSSETIDKCQPNGQIK